MRLETNCHMDEEAIEKYSLGNISEEEASRFEEHLLICESCQDRVTESDSYVSTMQCAGAQIRAKAVKTEKRRWSFPRLVPALAVAASFMFLAFVGLHWSNGQGKGPKTREPAVTIHLAATRGNGIEAKAPADRALTLQLDLAGLPPESSRRVEIVDQVGARVWQGVITTAPQDSKAIVSVPQIPRGLYFVRAYAPSGKLLREYGLEVGNR